MVLHILVNALIHVRKQFTYVYRLTEYPFVIGISILKTMILASIELVTLAGFSTLLSTFPILDVEHNMQLDYAYSMIIG